MKQLRKLLRGIRSALAAPNSKQLEAAGRLLHTLAAASMIGSFTLAFGSGISSLADLGRCGGLLAWGVVLFLLGLLGFQG
ncbi:hypothetical protein BKK79_37340 (plasmid) [Cupriavidus sp. USMAA2-4]|uniref:hypothetical protein n=1 Tax=Cupriavidus sp. USMAA2-4 TaxID=876364 RepID=UPI0008A69E5A|nr:hypothetical protein [Cupriavidus sp. USMAA2-4]AOY97601.1 hypothetical protein BKK79_37340 [Cupriavidus sp. USMAA2-4]